MNQKLYRRLVVIAVVMGVLWVGWSLYDTYFGHRAAGDTAYLTGNTAFADRKYQAALASYQQALQEDRDHLHALRGKARSLLMLQRYDEALEIFNQAIAREPNFAASYANRGILHDRMGSYELALADYEKSLELDAAVADGPNWLTRFLRLQPDKPPTVDQRAAYLREQLAKPLEEQVLSIPSEDDKQRPYQQ